MRSMLFTVAAVLIVFVPLDAVSSQAVPVTSGDRVRITVPNALHNQTAQVVSARGDSLFLRVTPAETLAVALAGVTRLDVRTGQRRYALRGAGIGAASGVIVGAFLGSASGDDRRSWIVSFTAEEKAVIYGVGLGLTGLAIGTIVGALTVSDRWTSVPLGAVDRRSGLRVGVHGNRLTAAISF